MLPWPLLALLPEICGIVQRMINIPVEVVRTHGPRVYQRGSILKRHVDKYRLTAIVHLASEGVLPWPLLLEFGDQNKEVVMAPGEIVVFEGSRIPHSRPSPLQDSYYASYFIDFRPAH